jgi:peptidyl-dipeptidase Dcp
MNPLMQKFETPFETAPFDLIKAEHFLPALTHAIEQGKKEIEEIKNNKEGATFSNVCEALELVGEDVTIVSSIFFNLHSAESNEEIQNIAKEFSPILTDYSNDLLLDEKLFEKVKSIYDTRESLNLTSEEMMLLEKQYKGFSRNGALLSEGDKNKIREIDKESAELRLNFGDNVLSETNSFVMLVDNTDDLIGLPDFLIEQAALAAKEKGEEGKWVFTLKYPSVIPFLKYSEKRELREKIYRAFSSRAYQSEKHDNQEYVKKIAGLRFERAQILGYKTHADFILEERMAETPSQVESFLKGFLDKAKPVAIQEMDELRSFAEKNGGPKGLDFQTWDYSHWAEKLRKEKFDFSEQELKPYFKLENVVKGVFEVAKKLYGLTFHERKDILVYHSDVKAYEVQDESKRHLSVFYADFFPREGKRSGAWMTSYREQRIEAGCDKRPHVSIVCNFTKPTDNTPSLLTFEEVTTLFHEFGHALHGMLSKVNFESLSGANVFWDFVELPSQILENWAYEKECLDLFADHFETHEKIPVELIQKIKNSANFHEGRATLRQISFGLLDMSWHGHDPREIEDVNKNEKDSMRECSLLPEVEGSNMSCSFSHIFQGGYSAGYYSYKWAEVLDADAFDAFKEKGIFNKEVADSFRENILEKGGSEHPKDLYRKFRGQDPSPDALLKRAGLL